MTVIRRWLCACVWSLVGAGCFTEPPSDDGPTTMIGQTAGDGCPEGSSSCECYGNGTCDAGLTCAEGANVCVPTGCEPGTEACTCGDGCVGDLECIGSVCMQPSDSSSSSDPSVGTTLPMTSTTSDDDSTTDSPQTESASASSASVGDTSSSSSSTQGLEDCGALDCEDCSACVGGPGQACEDLEETCEGLAGCPSAVDCLLYCATTGICGPCCEGITPEAADAAQALHTCRSDQCVVNLNACDPFSPGDCTP